MRKTVCLIIILILIASVSIAASIRIGDLKRGLNKTREMRKTADKLRDNCSKVHGKLDKDKAIDYTKKMGILGNLLSCKQHAKKAYEKAGYGADKMSLAIGYLSSHDCLNCLETGNCSQGHINECRDRFIRFQDGARIAADAEKELKDAFSFSEKAAKKLNAL